MIEQKDGESRKDYLLRVVVWFISNNGLEECLVDYDGTTCDGNCLMDDIESELESGA